MISITSLEYIYYMIILPIDDQMNEVINEDIY
jgi:hypothetical protein